MSKKNTFIFSPMDWLSNLHIKAMTLEQRGAYIDLLCINHIEGYIPSDAKKLSKIIGIESEKLIPVLERFTEIEPGKLSHKRVSKEREKNKIVSETKSKAAQKSVEVRKDKSAADVFNDWKQANKEPKNMNNTLMNALPITNFFMHVCPLKTDEGKEAWVNYFKAKEKQINEAQAMAFANMLKYKGFKSEREMIDAVYKATVNKYGEVYVNDNNFKEKKEVATITRRKL